MIVRSALAFSPGAAGPLLAAEDRDALSWQDAGLCAEVDPELFFPEKGGSVAYAKRVCRSCPVRPECLEYALENDERFGVWGGLSERERRRVKNGAGLLARRCRKGLHVLTDANTDSSGHCMACRNDSDRLARARKALAA